MPSPRVGITQRVDHLPDRNERRDGLDQRLSALLDSAGLLPVPIPNLLRDPAAFVDAMGLDLIILSGGNDLAHLPAASAPASERDSTEARLLDLTTERGIPVLGICRGLQMMVDHAGGTLTRVEGHAGTTHEIDVLDDSLWPLRHRRVVNSFHNWAVTPDMLGGSLAALALAPDGTVEAAHRPGLPQVCVMWHPEREPPDPGDLDLIGALLEYEAHASNHSRGG